MKTNDFVTINGLQWDTENFTSEDTEFFTHKEAVKAAASVGKRLPTYPEYWELIKHGSTWDEYKNGRWFGADHELKAAAKASLFFPAAGCITDAGRRMNKQCCGYYWIRRSAIDTAYALHFDIDFFDLAPGYYHTHRFSVRFVS